MPEFKDMLKYFRTRERLSQSELAEKLGVSSSTISMYEVGKREPDFEAEEKIADFFHTDLNTLRGRAAAQPEGSLRIVDYYNTLNDFGKHEAEKRVEELTYFPQYSNVAGVKAARNNYINGDGELERTKRDLSILKRPK